MLKEVSSEKAGSLFAKNGLEFPRQTADRYPLKLNPYCLGRIENEGNPEGPLWKQFMPSHAELDDADFPEDGLGEEKQSPLPRLIRRYNDRAVLLTTNRCAAHCRFCFRKRLWKNDRLNPDIEDAELEEICAFLSEHPEIREILISGGDPLSLGNERIGFILEKLRSTGTLNIMRICTRMPSVFPERIDSGFIKIISSVSGLWCMTHFNHPSEITDESAAACLRIVESGVPVLCQTVLLKGVNDSAEILEELFSKLVSIKVKPHYLFHVDPVRGVGHFATGIEKGLQLIEELRNRVSSLCTPAFAIDLPGGGGKVPMFPDYRDGDDLCFRALDGESIFYRPRLNADGESLNSFKKARQK